MEHHTDRVSFRSFDLESIPRADLPEFFILDAQEKAKRARSEGKKDPNTELSTDLDFLMVCCFCGYESSSDTFIELFARDLAEERQLLIDAWAWLHEGYQNRNLLVSFNGKSFDLPALFRRAMYQDLFISINLYRALTGRSDENHIDLMLALGNPSPFSSKPDVKGFDKTLMLYGIAGKAEGWNGSKVFPAFKEGNFEDIQLYCRGDVERVNALFRRTQPWIFEVIRTEATRAA